MTIISLNIGVWGTNVIVKQLSDNSLNLLFTAKQ